MHEVESQGQASQPGPTLLQVLRCGHRQVLAVLDQFTLAAQQGNAHTMELLAAAVAVALRLHCAGEEEVVVPLLRQCTIPGSPAPAPAEQLLRSMERKRLALDQDQLELLTCKRQQDWGALAARMQVSRPRFPRLGPRSRAPPAGARRRRQAGPAPRTQLPVLCCPLPRLPSAQMAPSSLLCAAQMLARRLSLSSPPPPPPPPCWFLTPVCPPLQMTHQDWAAVMEEQDRSVLPLLAAGLSQGQLGAAGLAFHQAQATARLAPPIPVPELATQLVAGQAAQKTQPGAGERVVLPNAVLEP